VLPLFFVIFYNLVLFLVRYLLRVYCGVVHFFFIFQSNNTGPPLSLSNNKPYHHIVLFDEYFVFLFFEVFVLCL